ncbi:MAG: cytochrome b/b6 domain-containing protein [Pseudomonadales bacterium]
MVWDLPVRVFHWSLAGFFSLAYWLGSDWPGLHAHAGYTVALLVGFRILWGFIGSTHARFADFVTAPAAMLRCLGALARGRPEVYRGHDPAGAAMILALLASLLVTALSGMSLFAMEGRGPLAGTAVAGWSDRPMVDVHHVASDLTLVLVAVHVAGVLITSALTRTNLVRAMITGRKPPVGPAAGGKART